MTFLIATPTFLQAYMRRCSPEDFGSLQYVLVGAEKLPERMALAFEETSASGRWKAMAAPNARPWWR